MKKKTKSFDAVKNMRRIRDQLSRKFNAMTFEEQKQYLKDKVGDKMKPPPETAKRAR